MALQPPRSSDQSRGALAAFLCFVLWGIVPLYWKQMEGIEALELIAHRVAWSLAFLALVLVFRRDGFRTVRSALSDGPVLRATFLSGALLTANWLIYIWAVTHDEVIESSFGYFLVPLVNVALGSWVLGERLRPPQWIAIGCAAAGVGFLLFGVGRVPWIALAIAATWGGYGLMRKRSSLGAIDGLMLETILYAPLALGYLAWRQHTGEGVLGHADLRTHLFVLSTGWVTALPLILFAYGARRIPLSTIGVLQYVAPTVQFLIGLLVYHEPFDAARLHACLFIWCGLAIYTADSFWSQRRALRAAVMGGSST